MGSYDGHRSEFLPAPRQRIWSLGTTGTTAARPPGSRQIPAELLPILDTDHVVFFDSEPDLEPERGQQILRVIFIHFAGINTPAGAKALMCCPNVQHLYMVALTRQQASGYVKEMVKYLQLNEKSLRMVHFQDQIVKGSDL
ncbi:unnamed protein product [Durusdinium trenchii]|uniref:Uncharacterized protein n=1 Tax=Durusdinium trenchii TaxID=1381693 RepID=A0ABP0Q476_9DINO